MQNGYYSVLQDTSTHREECARAARLQGAVLDFVLIGEVLRALDGILHALYGEEGGHVGGVGGDHDEGEEPPDPRHQARGRRLRRDLGPWRVRN